VEDAATDGDKFISYRNTLVCSLKIQIPRRPVLMHKMMNDSRTRWVVPCISMSTAPSFINPIRVKCRAPLAIVQLFRTLRETLVLHACAIGVLLGVFEYSIRRIRISEKTKNSIRIQFVRNRIRIAISQFDSRELTLREFVHELFEEVFEYSVPIRGDSL
jgi:hypothetical protein